MDYHLLDTTFEDFIIRIALTATQATRIDKALEDVTRIMLEDLSNIEVYVQGSFATATTVKPLTENQNPGNPGEYDVDIVIERTNWGTPQDSLNKLSEILAASETFGGNTIEVKGKCVRINFPPDSTSTAFHVDVVPILNDAGVRKVANGETGDWQESDSKALVDWFLAKKDQHPFMPAVVMIIKRMRDVALLTDVIPSIAIQALVVANYQNRGTYAADLLHVIKHIDQIFQNRVEDLEISNPVNLDEDLAERWRVNPGQYRDLQDYFANVREVLQTELESQQPDTDELREMLSTDFPSTLAPAELDSLRSDGYSINSDNFMRRLPIDHQSRHGRLVDALTRIFFEINKAITFKAPSLNHANYNIKWQVLNATGSPSRRGNLFQARSSSGGPSVDMHTNNENEQYLGSHWIRYFVFDEDTKQCIGRSRKFNVRVMGNQG
jgi:hypothetical protein